MEQKYIDYLRIDPTFSWPEQIKQAFEIIQRDNIFLEPGSQEEKEFLALCVELEIVPFISKYGVFGCSKKEVGNCSHYYLELKTSLDYPKRKFEDRSTGCPGDNRPCGNGIVQVEKISLSVKMAKKLERLGIMSMFSAGVRNHILVARRVKELFISNAVTGYRLVPCLEEGTKYAPEDYLFAQKRLELENQAKYFQLIVTARVLQYPNIGKLLKWSQCSLCGIVGAFLPHLIEGNTMFFQAGDLNTADFQSCDGRCSDNIGLFHTKSDWIIVSAKVLRLLVDYQVRGIDAASWPKIEVEIVDIR